MEIEARPRLPPIVQRFLRAERGPRVRLLRLERFIDAFTKDPRTKGLLVRLGPLDAGWARVSRIQAQLARARAAGKTVLVHLTHSADNREYFAALGGTRIMAVPSALIAPVGAAARTIFLKETLERAGVRFEVAAAGRFKSAPEAFTRTDRSESDREQTLALVQSIDAALVSHLAEARKVDETQAKAWIDAAPLTGHQAVPTLLDGVAHDEDLPAEIQRLAGLLKPPALVPAGRYASMAISTPLFRPRRVIGIVEVHGAIGESRFPAMEYLEPIATERTVVADLRAALADGRIGAVVLHVDSRGGSVLASDAIYAAVRRLAAEKPVIACFGDVAASGGYYVACGAQAIVASPLTVTGSIGAFLMLPTWSELAVRLGLHLDVIRQRKNAAAFDPWQGVSAEEHAHLSAQIAATYRAFVAIVARARSRSIEEIEGVAQGRVWMGSDAARVGLVDGLGGMTEAMARARAAAKARLAEEPVVIRARKPLPRPPAPPAPPAPPEAKALGSLIRYFLQGTSGAQVAAELLALLPAAQRSPLAYAPLSVP